MKRLDDGIGVQWNGGFQNLLDESSFMSKGLTDDVASVSSFGGSNADSRALLNAASFRAGDNAKVAARSEPRPVPVPITASRSAKGPDTGAYETTTAQGEPNGVAEKQRSVTPVRSPPPQPATASNVPQMAMASNVAPKAGTVTNAVARNPGVSPLRNHSPVQQRPQPAYPGSAGSSATAMPGNFVASANSSVRVPSAGPAPVRTAPMGSYPAPGGSYPAPAQGGYPAGARQMPPSDPRGLPQSYSQVAMNQGPRTAQVSPMRNANVPGYGAPRGQAGASGFFNLDM